MAFQFDNRASWMDIAALVGGALAAIAVLHRVDADVSRNAQNIEFIQIDVARIESEADRRDTQILEQLEAQRHEMKDYRTESKIERGEITKKLDRIIERELD